MTLAEKEGKTVELLVVPAVDPFAAMVQSAAKLEASRLGVGVSARMASEEVAHRIGLAWEKMPEPSHAFSLEITNPDRPSTFVNLGPHPPRLWPEDVARLHKIWLRLSEFLGLGSKIHRRDIVGIALRWMEKELDTSIRMRSRTPSSARFIRTARRGRRLLSSRTGSRRSPDCWPNRPVDS